MIAYLPDLHAWVIAAYTIAIGVSGGLATEIAHHKAEVLAALATVGAWLCTRLRRGRHARLVSRPRLTASHGTRRLPREPRTPGRHETGAHPIVTDAEPALEAAA